MLSSAGCRAVLIEAIARARRAGELEATAAVAGWPGYRRRLRDRIAGWTRFERPPEGATPGGGPAIADEWAVYGHYRRLLDELEAVDPDGLASWASHSLVRTTPAVLRPAGSLAVTVLDLEDEPPAVHRVLSWFEARAKSVRLAMAYDADPGQAEVYAAVAPVRQRLLERGYEEEAVAPGFYRPQGLRDLERRLFRADSHTMSPLSDVRGLTVIGAPQGEGVGLVVAREVRRRLVDGSAPEDLLVLVRRWDEDAEAVLGVLRSWSLPVSAPGRPRRTATEPAVSALRLALQVPAGGWEAVDVVQLLRHGRFRPDWAEVGTGDLPARTALALHESTVYRGRDALLQALDRAIDAAKEDRARRAAIEVRALAGRLVSEIDAVDRSGTRRAHVERLRRLAAALGLESGGRDDAVDAFWMALDDHAAARDALGQDDEPVELAAFAREVDGLADELTLDDEPVTPGTVVMTTVEGAAGARAGHVFLVNLAEGTFPTRDAVELVVPVDLADDPEDETDEPAARPDLAFAREMARFLGVVGAADTELILAYPTRDEKGQEVLSAGFLDDVLRSFDPSALAPAHERHTRLDPVLIDHPDLAVAPGDARVRAVALACMRHDGRALRALAAEPQHRPALLGSAVGLELAGRRFQKTYTHFDGLLTDPAAVAAIAARFGPESVFSASQLESYLYCPFQFFMKFVLGLKPVDDSDELDEDYVGRGDRVHEMLERFETLRREGRDNLIELSEIVLHDVMRVELTVESEIDPARHAIEERRLERTLRNYVAQARAYEGEGGDVPRPRHLEVPFGDPKRDARFPVLEIGAGASAVKVRGKIDRVDVIATNEGPAFRVIDYKTGPCPSSKEVRELDMLQLPLYALAVERLVLHEEGAAFRDVGYWELRDRGYLPVTKIEWESFREDLLARVEEAVARLRRGLFMVRPRRDDCTSHCDFRAVCRIGQMRSITKREPGSGGSETP